MRVHRHGILHGARDRHGGRQQPGVLQRHTEPERHGDRHGAVQCGFCFPGITCSLESKLKNVEKPSRKEVADALAGHICRCTGYVPIIEAAAGEGIARGRESDNAFKNICRSPVREDSASKLNGSALYADDLQFENMLHVHVLRSAHARARIVSIDADDARKASGVALVLTHKELPGSKKFGILKHDQPVLCSDKVLFYGDAVALVAAGVAAVERLLTSVRGQLR